MATMTKTAEDMRARLFDDDEADRGAVKAAYDETVAASAAKRQPVRTLQKIMKLVVNDLDTEPRSKKRARNAVKQLAEVPLTPENCTWYFEQAMRSALQDELNEWAEADQPQEDTGAKSPKNRQRTPDPNCSVQRHPHRRDSR